MFRFKNLFFLAIILTSLLSSCKKEAIDIPEIAAPSTQVTPETTETDQNMLTSFRALAAAAKSNNRSNAGPDEDNPCGCYDIFEGIDFEAAESEIEEAVDAVLDNLTEEELIRLFEPVCTAEGQIFESSCVADCEGITGYEVCTDEELEDYFFDDFDCNLDSLSFPMEFELPDGSTVTVNNEEELFAAFDQWYEENGEAWEEDWGHEWEDEWEDDYEECFTVMYPVDIVFPDGSTQTFNSDEEIEEGIDTWYEANKESEEYPMPVYPVSVQLEDSTVISIENEEQFEELESECYGDFEDDFCFDLVFPMTLTLPDGSTTTANNEEELEDIIEATLGEEVEEDEIDDAVLALILPFDIQLEDGTQQTIATQDDLEAAFISCFDKDGFGRKAPVGTSDLIKVQKPKRGLF